VSSGCAPPWSQCAAGGAARVTGIVRVLNLRQALLVGVRVLGALALGLLARLHQVLLVGDRVLVALALGLLAPLRQAITGFPGLPPLVFWMRRLPIFAVVWVCLRNAFKSWRVG